MGKEKKKTTMLTEREIQVLYQIAEGKLNKEISADFDISIDTVKKHIKNIYRKINARNRIDAVHYALLLKSQEAVLIPIS